MKTQNYSNHGKSYPAHHFVFYPVIIILLIFAVRQALAGGPDSDLWWMMSAGIFLIGWLSFMTRQHYALTIQDRVVRLEMRLRYFELTGKRFEPFEARLGFDRIAALRFASDPELPDLLGRALSENLSAKAIKQAVKNWVPDSMRV